MRHIYLLYIKRWCSIYWRGSYCWLEFDFRFRKGGMNHVIQLFTKKGIFNYFSCPF